MFRENVLVNDGIIRRIKSTMVPVALDYQKVLDRETRESRFMRPLMKQRNQNQGVWIFSPEGKALGGFEGFGDMVGKMNQILDIALKSFGPVTPRDVKVVETHPHRGKGVRPDGSVTLAEYVRQRSPDRIKSPVISSVTLSRGEFSAFAPREAVAGREWKLPEAVAKKLCRLASPMCYQHAPQPDWVTGISLKAEVLEIRGRTARLSYEGSISSRRLMGNGKVLSEQKVRFEGEGLYDIRAKKMRSVLIVGTGIFRWPEEAPNKTVPFDAMIEWEFRSSKEARKN